MFSVGSGVFRAVAAGSAGGVGSLIWLAERRRNAEQFAEPLAGIGSGMWFALVTLTTVGYGDKARSPAWAADLQRFG